MPPRFPNRIASGPQLVSPSSAYDAARERIDRQRQNPEHTLALIATQQAEILRRLAVSESQLKRLDNRFEAVSEMLKDILAELEEIRSLQTDSVEGVEVDTASERVYPSGVDAYRSGMEMIMQDEQRKLESVIASQGEQESTDTAVGQDDADDVESEAASMPRQPPPPPTFDDDADPSSDTI